MFVIAVKLLLKKKKKIIKLEETLNMLDLLQIIHRTAPTINELIKGSNFDGAVDLL